MAATSPQAASTQSKPAAPRVPAFQWDHTWPKELPNNWLVGNVVGVAVDSRDNVWIVHRPNSQTGAEKTPAVLAFDQSGNLVRSWGAPGAGLRLGHAGAWSVRRLIKTMSGSDSAAACRTTSSRVRPPTTRTS